MGDFISSFKYIKAGFGLILKSGIRMYVLLPLLINFLLFSAVIAFGAHLLADFIDWLVGQFTWAEWLTWLLWPLFAVVCLIAVFFCFSVVANLVAAPFNGFLAQAVENHLSGNSEADDGSVGNATLIQELVAALKSEFIKFRYFAVRGLPLLLLFVIPVINVTLAPFIWFLFGSWMMALEYMDYPMGNSKLLFPEIHATLKEKRSTAMGFGVAVMLLTMVPIINFIAMPVAVCGATKLWLDKIKDSTDKLSADHAI